MMKAVLHKFKNGVPERDLYLKGQDFEEQEFEVNCEEAKELLKQLRENRDNLSFDNLGSPSLDFSFESDGSLFVEVTSAKFWALSKVSVRVAEAVIDHVYQGREFGEHVPSTNEIWYGCAFL